MTPSKTVYSEAKVAKVMPEYFRFAVKVGTKGMDGKLLAMHAFPLSKKIS